MKIYLIVTRHIEKCIADYLMQITPDCEYEILSYRDSRHMAEIAAHLPESADGFIIGGQIALNYFHTLRPDIEKPVIAIQYDSNIMFRAVLQMLVNDRNIDINRIYIDYLTLDTSSRSCAQLLDATEFSKAAAIATERLLHPTLERLDEFTQEIGSTMLELWRQGKLEHVICLFSEIMSYLQAHNVPCTYIFPDKEYVSRTIEQMITLIKIRTMQLQRPAAIALHLHVSSQEVDANWENAVFQKVLQEFSQKHMLDFVMKSSDKIIEIYTSQEIIEKITSNYKHCGLTKYLKDRSLHVKVDIGYGIGSDIVHAKNNAIKAMRHGAINGGRYIIDLQEHIIGPLEGENVVAYTKNSDPIIREKAKQAHLSEITIQRILHIMEKKKSKEISAKDFVELFGGTVRNANRILSKLEESGLAVACDQESAFHIGRPAKIYEVMISDQ